MTILNENGVTVTETAVNIPGQPLRIGDIRSTRVATDKRGVALPVSISVIGAILLVIGFMRASGAFWVPGIMLVVVGWLAWWTQDTRHRLFVTTESKGEVEALVSADIGFLERVVAAIQSARDAKQQSAP
jgi:membrane-bound ClpP family serine protease